MIKQPSFSNIIGRNKSLFELFFNGYVTTNS